MKTLLFFGGILIFVAGVFLILRPMPQVRETASEMQRINRQKVQPNYSWDSNWDLPENPERVEREFEQARKNYTFFYRAGFVLIGIGGILLIISRVVKKRDRFPPIRSKHD